MPKWEAFKHRCVYCGKGAQGYDHKIAISRGGTNHASNLAPACTRCNSRKSNRTPEEFRAYLGFVDRKMPVVFWNEKPPALERDYLIVISRSFMNSMLEHNGIS